MTEISAHITGTIWKILVTPGQSVAEGETLVIIESMKMEMPVEAADAGVVQAVLVAEGDAVEEGDVLVRLK